MPVALFLVQAAAAQPEKARVPPELEKLWSNCAKHFLPIRDSDEAKLMEMEHGLLEGWGVDPAAARKLAVSKHTRVGTETFLGPRIYTR